MVCQRGLRVCQRGLGAARGAWGLPERSEGLPEGPEGLPEGPEEAGGDGRTYGRTDGRTDVRTYGISPHSTGLRPLSGPLPKKQGKGTTDLMMLFGDWFVLKDGEKFHPHVCPYIRPFLRCPGASFWAAAPRGDEVL